MTAILILAACTFVVFYVDTAQKRREYLKGNGRRRAE
jgi:hypothetical protein